MSRLSQYQLRIPSDLRSAVSELAKANKRPMNSEIIAAIEAHLAASGVAVPAEGNPSSHRIDTFVAAAFAGLTARYEKPSYAEAIALGMGLLKELEANGR